MGICPCFRCVKAVFSPANQALMAHLHASPCWGPAVSSSGQPTQPLPALQLQQHRRNTIARAGSVGRTAFSYETSRLTKTLITRQAIKTVLNYLSETNGELHFFLHNYVAEHPLPLAPGSDADQWLVALASSPLAQVQDPRRSSVASVAAAAAALQGTREVSPREVADRILGVREHISKELLEELALIPAANMDVRRTVLNKTVAEFKFEP